MIRGYYTKVFSSLEENAFFKHLNKVEEKRREKILSAGNPALKYSSLTAGSLLHAVLCRELKLSPEEKGPFSVSYAKNGKPYLSEYPELFFNLSHSGEYVCCTAGDEPVGTDIQKMVPFKESIACRFFTDREKHLLKDSEEKEELFFRLWTIKESFLKLTGAGLGAGLDTFEIDFKDRRIFGAERLRENDNKNRGKDPEPEAYFAEWKMFPGYCLCVSARQPIKELPWQELVLM